MATERHHFKVGLFVVALVTIAVAFLFWIGASSIDRKESLTVGLYFNESIQGLSEGSGLQYRGFKVGEVSAIDVANDHKHIAVECLVRRDFLEKIGVGRDLKSGGGAPPIASGVVATLISSGLTGLKYVEIDLPEQMPAEAVMLPDGVEPNSHVQLVIATAPSTLRSVEIAVNDAMEAIRMHGPNVGGIVSELNGFLKSLNESGVTKEATETIKNLDQRIVELDTKGLSDSAKGVFNEVNRAVGETSKTLDVLTQENGDLRRMIREIESTAGVISSEVKAARLPETTAAVIDGATRLGNASDSVANVATDLSGIVVELGSTLKSIRATVDELRALVVILEQDPSSLLYGRQYRMKPPSDG